MDRRVVALSLLSRLPVLSVAAESPEPLAAASAATGGTWPVFFTPHPQEDAQLLCEVGVRSAPAGPAVCCSSRLRLPA